MLTFHDLGRQVEELFAAARREIVIVSPFIKAAALKRALSRVPADVELRVVTRWHLEEISAGVSDLEVYDLLMERGNATLRLADHLHAKAFRADNRALAGSANLTARGLGWLHPSNIEILTPLQQADVSDFEDYVFGVSYEASPELHADLAALVEAMPKSAVIAGAMEEHEQHSAGEEPPARTNCWLPQSRYPENLALAYRGRCDALTTSGRVQAGLDLFWLSPPAGLDETRLRQYVRARLLAHPLVRVIDQQLEQGDLRFGTARQVCGVWLASNRIQVDATELWQTLLRWLLYFAGDRYQYDVPGQYSEVLSRRIVRTGL